MLSLWAIPHGSNNVHPHFLQKRLIHRVNKTYDVNLRFENVDKLLHSTSGPRFTQGLVATETECRSCSTLFTMHNQDEGGGSYQTTTNTSLKEMARDRDIILQAQDVAIVRLAMDATLAKHRSR
jgi:hypothetical protein